MTLNTISNRKRLSTVAILSLLATGLVAVAAVGERVALADAGVTAAPADTGKVSAGTAVKATTYDKAPEPTAEQAAVLKEDTGHRDGPRGVRGPEPTAKKPSGPGTRPPGPGVEAPNDLTFYRNQRIPAGGQYSPVNEPSATQAGQNIFHVGNWYSTYSHNSGANWTFLNPFTLFGSGFCCDQMTSYDVGHNRQFWLLQYNDGHLTLANSSADDLAGWCYWNWTPANFGLPAGSSFDFNKMALSTNFVYLATNVYPGGGSLVARFPIDPMTTCAGFSYSWYYRTTEFSPSLIQNAQDAMYWGSNWTNMALGSTFRIARWEDTAGAATFYDRSIAAYVFMFIGGGNCGSANGVVLNWCQRTDSRMTGPGYLAAPARGSSEATIGFAFNAQQDGAHPFPYIRRVYFKASDLTYLGASEFWGSWAAHIYPALAPDYRGHVGMAFAWGGGTGTAAYYPGSGIMLDDDISPVQPWAYSFYQSGAGNPCLNGDGLRRWGDYLDIHPFYPSGYGFVATGFALNAHAGACNTTANVSMANVAFGRVRDTAAYTRWR